MIARAQAQRIGSYEPLRLLGRGSSCVVYEAKSDRGERVALKQLLGVDPVSLSRFKQEFRAVQGLHHPHLVELLELFEHDGSSAIAMELVEGEDLVSFLRASDNDPCFDVRTLRSCFSQLTEALMALHAAGVVHRDLKPRNVLVTHAGRVVLLDFGLIKTLNAQSTALPGVGSADYMAPEQAAGGEVGPAADFYALGVCLYEALSGTTPFTAPSPFELMELKQRAQPRHLGELVQGLSEDLESLCMRLLAAEPTARPTGPEVLRLLRAEAQDTAAPAAQTRLVFQSDGFSGRRAELTALGAAFERTRQKSLEIAFVEGESGIGKSALVAEFTAALSHSRADAIILMSRCYENEQLAYKGFDAGMEQLSRLLSRMNPGACEALLPARAALLARLFPVFAQVASIAAAPTRALPADPATQRLAGFDALGALLAKIAERRPVVIVIDDLQWADTESFRLLAALLEARARMQVLVLCTIRAENELEDDVARALAPIRARDGTFTIPLRGLPAPEARSLARALMAPGTEEATLDAVVAESGGHPLFLAELARFAVARGAGATQHVSLDAALSARIDALPSQSQRLLEAVALAGRPYPAPLFARIASIEIEEMGVRSAELLAQKLLRRRSHHELACFHDRIRSAAVSRLSLDQTRALHRRIAQSLASAETGDAAELARHHDAAGDEDEALSAYARAGAQALSALAFARAEHHYRRALEIAQKKQLPAREWTELRIARGHALARGGRSTEAARQYLEAVDEAEGEEKVRLRIWAAQHLLQSAQIEDGIRAARALLSELGVPLPASSAGVIARLLWDRTWLGLRGLTLKQSSISSAQRIRLDAMWGLTHPVHWIEVLPSAALCSRHLRLAVALGDRSHVANALGQEAAIRAMRDPYDAAVDRFLTRARELGAQRRDPGLEMALAYNEGRAALFRWKLPAARERFQYAEQLGTEQCPDEPWLLTNVRQLLGLVWCNLGEHGHFVTHAARWVDEARQRNDPFAVATLEGLGYGFMRHLMAHDPDRALGDLAESMAPWSRERFTFAHLGEIIGVVYSELYRGGDGAHGWLERETERLSRAPLLQVNLSETAYTMFRALAVLSAWNGPAAQRRGGLLSETRAAIRRIARSKAPLAYHNGPIFEAQLAALEGRTELAIALAQRAKRQSEEFNYWISYHPASYLEGLLEGGEGGREKRARALEFLREQGWRDPRRAVGMRCPAIDWLEAKGR